MHEEKSSSHQEPDRGAPESGRDSFHSGHLCSGLWRLFWPLCTPFCTFWIVRRMPSMYPLSMQRNSSITRHTGWEITAWLS